MWWWTLWSTKKPNYNFLDGRNRCILSNVLFLFSKWKYKIALCHWKAHFFYRFILLLVRNWFCSANEMQWFSFRLVACWFMMNCTNYALYKCSLCIDCIISIPWHCIQETKYLALVIRPLFPQYCYFVWPKKWMTIVN